MKSIIVITVVLSYLSFNTFAEDVRLTDLDPNEASQIIESKDQSLKYAPKVDSNVPAVRVLGRDPHNVLEDIYLANQYHGQDGLGGYLYGYSVPDIAKTEKKKAGGDLKGAYNYINGDGQEIKVEYWDDGTGFHQIDNIPKILPQQIEDTPEVKAAKEEHARIWQEQAERNSHAPVDPNGGGSDSGDYDGEYDQQGPSTGYINQPGRIPVQVGTSPYQTQVQFQGPSQGQAHYISQAPSQSQGQGQYAPPPSQGQYAPQRPPQSPQPAPYPNQQQAQGQYGQQQPQYSQQNQAQYGQQQPQYNQQGQGQYGQQQPQYNQQSQGQYQPQSQGYRPAGQPQGQYAGAGQYQPQGQYKQAGSSGAGPNSVEYSGQYSEKTQSYAASPYNNNQARNEEKAEESGPPRGFFYSVDYPVGIIVQDQGKLLQKREEVNNIYEKKKAELDQQLKHHGDYRVKRAIPSYPVYVYY